jgi:hypothetical protein
MLILILGALAFVGTHFLLSHPLRAPLVGALGEKGFFGPLFAGIAGHDGLDDLGLSRGGAGRRAAVDGTGAVPWLVASGRRWASRCWPDRCTATPPCRWCPARRWRARASGVFAVTRHPMMWAWAAGRWRGWRTARVAVLMGAMIVLALAGAALQDGKKAAALGPRLGRRVERADLVLAAAAGLAKITPLQWAIGTGAVAGRHLWPHPRQPCAGGDMALAGWITARGR